MPEGSILSDDFIRELINVGEVDILVAVPTHNDGRTVGPVVQAVRAGLLKYFPRARAVIINADGGSHDGTQSGRPGHMCLVTAETLANPGDAAPPAALPPGLEAAPAGHLDFEALAVALRSRSESTTR